jgi:hypothetical protein
MGGLFARCEDIRREQSEDHDECQHEAQKTLKVNFHFFSSFLKIKLGNCFRLAAMGVAAGRFAEVCIPNLTSRRYKRQV